jgi:hypothetical protein
MAGLRPEEPGVHVFTHCNQPIIGNAMSVVRRHRGVAMTHGVVDRWLISALAADRFMNVSQRIKRKSLAIECQSVQETPKL